MKTSAEGLAFITLWEGTRLTAYRDSGGVWTIGVGHTGPEVKRGLTITAERARQLLAADVAEAEWAVSAVQVPLTQQQYDALVSFTFNVGTEAFERSTLLRKLNERDYASVPAQINRWVHDNGKVVAGLVNRRKAEGEMWALGSTAVENVHPPEQTSTIPSAPIPARKPDLSTEPPIADTSARPVNAADPWWVRLLSLILSLFGRKPA